MTLQWFIIAGSLEEPGGSSVLEDLTLGLAGGAIVGGALGAVYPSDRIAAAGAGCIFLSMDGHEMTVIFGEVVSLELSADLGNRVQERVAY